uniref:Protein kinase domain-containing protein n=1 Tax=Rhinolophus ferrumequinum TaxID=59479 RepID=A0A671G3L3_RHIFE
MKGSGKRKLDQRVFLEQVHECRDKGYLLSSKIGSSAFSKVYLAYATQERIMHNCKLASDLKGKRHTMVAIKIVSTAEAPVEFSCKFLPLREIYLLYVRTACPHPVHPGGQPAPRLLLTPGPPHFPPGTLCSGPKPILRPQSTALHSCSLG